MKAIDCSIKILGVGFFGGLGISLGVLTGISIDNTINNLCKIILFYLGIG